MSSVPAPQVTVYSKPACVACAATKRHLKKLGIEHTIIDITANPEAVAYLKILGYRTMPVVTADLTGGVTHWADYRPDRVDHAHSPRCVGYSFTFERGRGVVFHQGESRGCKLWYLGHDEYDRAHTEADRPL